MRPFCARENSANKRNADGKLNQLVAPLVNNEDQRNLIANYDQFLIVVFRHSSSCNGYMSSPSPVPSPPDITPATPVTAVTVVTHITPSLPSPPSPPSHPLTLFAPAYLSASKDHGGHICPLIYLGFGLGYGSNSFCK